MARTPRTPRSARTPSTPLTSARGGQRKHLSIAPVFTERQQSDPGPWVEFASSRVQRGRFDYGLRQIHVIFADGTPWVYDQIPYTVWVRFMRSASQGQFINRVLNNYPYRRGDFV